MFTEEELLEAVDILVETFNFDEDYAIELVNETYEEEVYEISESMNILTEDYGYSEEEAYLLVENELLSELKRSTYEAAIAERGRRAEQARQEYEEKRDKWLKDPHWDDEKAREKWLDDEFNNRPHYKIPSEVEKDKASEKAIDQRYKLRRSEARYKNKFSKELEEERNAKRKEELKKEYEFNQEKIEKENKEKEEQRQKEYEAAKEKDRKEQERATSNFNRYHTELEGGRKRANERYVADREKRRKRNLKIAAGAAVVAGSAYIVHKAYKKHKEKAKNDLKNKKRNRGRR